MLAFLRSGRLSGGKLLASVASFVLLGASGCTLSPPGYMDDYATIGGKWQRTDPVEGRVGSPFSDSSVMFGHAAVAGLASGPGVVNEGEVIYDDGIIIDGTGFDSYEEHVEGEPFYENGIEIYEDGIEIVPQYETPGENW